MDRETAQTLEELERKLGELESELAAVGAANSNSRLIDEAAATVPAPPPPPRPARTASSGNEELLRFRERLEQTAAELTRDYDELLGRLSYAAVPTSTAISVGPTISFARGAPSLDIVDVDGLREAAARALESDPGAATAYGTSVGYLKLRAWIAEKHGVAPENVIVTNGSMQADAFLFEQLVGAGDEVVVERPTYDRTLLSLRKRGARVHAVQLQPDGIDTNALARLLEGPTGAQPKLAHVIPNFQNPAGYTLSAAKRRALLGLAARHGFVVFEDDPYVELRFEGEPIETMLSMDPERVVYASSFSKTVCPGIRVGYLVGPRELIASVAELATSTYISPSMVAQAIVYEFCASGAIERSIATVKTALSQRAGALAQALRRELPEAEFVEPQGGYFMWVTLPPGTDVATLFKVAAERGVAFVKGTDFLLEGGENTLRLAYSGVTPEQIDEGVARLADAYRSL
ncbi:MAG TPA: PLP-dependent aminotransferase family protein [Solirubrobacteraceae bacterium]